MFGPYHRSARPARGASPVRGELFSTTELLDGSEPVVGRVAGASALLDAFIDQGREMVAQRESTHPCPVVRFPVSIRLAPPASLLLLCASDYRFVPLAGPRPKTHA